MSNFPIWKVHTDENLIADNIYSSYWLLASIQSTPEVLSINSS